MFTFLFCTLKIFILGGKGICSLPRSSSGNTRCHQFVEKSTIETCLYITDKNETLLYMPFFVNESIKQLTLLSILVSLLSQKPDRAPFLYDF